MMDRFAAPFEAVYANGVLRPLTPVDLPEHQRLSVTVNGLADPMADVLNWDVHELAATEGDESVSLEDVQQTLSKIPGSLAAVVSAERDENNWKNRCLKRLREIFRCEIPDDPSQWDWTTFYPHHAEPPLHSQELKPIILCEHELTRGNVQWFR